MTLTIAQTLQYAAQAGFSGNALTTITAIAMCESGLDPTSDNTTTSGLGIDRGLVKINSYFHPEVSDACAHDPQCAMQQAFRISNSGTNFNQWVTFTNGCYRNNLTTVQAAQQNTPLGNLATIQTSSLNGPVSGNPLQTAGVIMDWLSNPQRLIKMIVGLVLIGIAIAMLVSPEAVDVAKKAAVAAM